MKDRGVESVGEVGEAMGLSDMLSESVLTKE